MMAWLRQLFRRLVLGGRAVRCFRVAGTQFVLVAGGWERVRVLCERESRAIEATAAVLEQRLL